MNYQPIACHLHDYLEIACMRHYHLSVELSNGDSLNGKATTLTTSTDKAEWLTLTQANQHQRIRLDEIGRITATDPMASFRTIEFARCKEEL